MKLTLAETKLLKESVSIMADLVTDVRFLVKKDALELVAMDPANVAMIVFKLLSSAFISYELKNDESISINLNELKQVLRRVKPSDTMSLEVKDNKLKITLKSSSTRQFYIPLIDLEEREQKVPSLTFDASITTLSTILVDAIEDVDVIGESVTFFANPKIFRISSSSDLKKAEVEITSKDETAIDTEKEVKAKYSIEYLKKMMQGSKLSEAVTIRFSNDYPLELEYSLVDKMVLKFILAPRVDND